MYTRTYILKIAVHGLTVLIHIQFWVLLLAPVGIVQDNFDFFDDSLEPGVLLQGGKPRMVFCERSEALPPRKGPLVVAVESILEDITF